MVSTLFTGLVVQFSNMHTFGACSTFDFQCSISMLQFHSRAPRVPLGSSQGPALLQGALQGHCSCIAEPRRGNCRVAFWEHGCSVKLEKLASAFLFSSRFGYVRQHKECKAKMLGHLERKTMIPSDRLPFKATPVTGLNTVWEQTCW